MSILLASKLSPLLPKFYGRRAVEFSATRRLSLSACLRSRVFGERWALHGR
jgi:hypothetical protein